MRSFWRMTTALLLLCAPAARAGAAPVGAAPARGDGGVRSGELCREAEDKSSGRGCGGGEFSREPPGADPVREKCNPAAVGGRSASTHKVWVWNGHSANTIDLGVKREVGTAGSNQAVTETAPIVYLSADGTHLFWFANQARRLQREGTDLSTTTTWQAWQTDLAGEGREELATEKFPDCRCATGTCEETCAYGVVWVPEGGVDKVFLMTQFVAGQTEPTYKASTRYRADGGKWTAEPLPEPLRRVLDAAPDGSMLVEAIPDAGCCGWSNESNDQTLVRLSDDRLSDGKKRIVFDEREAYQNPDYDVSFYTSTAKLSPERGFAAMTIVATAQVNKPIQLAEDGQANPEELQRIKKALAEIASGGSEGHGRGSAEGCVCAACRTRGMDQRERDSGGAGSFAGGLQRGDGRAEEVERARGRCGQSVSAVNGADPDVLVRCEGLWIFGRGSI